MHDAPWLDEGWREFGQSERSGPADNPRVIALYRDAGHPEIANDEVAWCAAFCGACLARAGVRGTGSLMARSYLAWGEPLDAPRPGAVAVFSRGSSAAEGHVGFWLGETRDAVVLLGGNQGNAVSVTTFPKARLLGLRWPETDAVAVPPSADPIFGQALVHVLEMEGGFSDDAHDPGGPTNLGITLETFASWRGTTVTAANRETLVAALKAIDPETVRAIYRRRYWDTAHCAELTPALALMQFDTAVNQGPGTAIRLLQEAVGATVDGEIGPETRAAIARVPVTRTLEAYARIREARYRALPHFSRFGRGWLNRLDATLALARTLTMTSTQSQGDETMATTNGTTDVTTQGKWWGHSLTIWGTIVTALATVLPALAPVTGIDITGDLVRTTGDQIVGALQAIAGLAGTVMTIYGRLRAKAPIERRAFTLRI
jgi:uncharacterized protein (TIGR02594 family)